MYKFIVAFVAVLSLGSSLAFAQLGWYWQNPLPQGNKLTAITSTNSNKLFAVGYGGAFLRSTNAGINWMNLTLGNLNSYKKIYFVNENVGFVIRGDNAILRTINSGLNWDSIYTPSIVINNMCFKNANTGIIFGNSQQVYKTTNSGNNWFLSSTISASNLTLYEGQYLNDSSIVCVGGTYVYLPPYYGYYASIILKSNNDGLNWTAVSSDDSKVAYSVNFINEKTGFVSGYNSYFKKTINGGNNWSLGTLGPEYHSYKIRLVDSLYGYSMGSNPVNNNRYISVTTNGGSSWSTNVCNNGIYDFVPLARNIIVGAGDFGNIFRTTNSGNNWMNLRTSSYSNSLGCIFSVSDSVMIAGGADGNIVKTTNNGFEWNQIITGISGGITSIYFVDNFLGFATTPLHIYKSSNGGMNWNLLFNSTDFIENIYMLNASTGFICERSHKIKKTINGGMNWNDLIIESSLMFSKIKFLNDQTGFVASRFASGTTPAVFKTTNGGYNWTGYSGPIKAQDIYFINANTGFTAGYEGEIFKTTDGGINWVSKSYPTSSVLNSITFINSNTGYIVGYIHTIMLKTTNCGDNWQEAQTGLDYDDGFLYGITSRNGHATLVGENGIIKSTRDLHFVSIRNIQNEIPRNYLLHQNYPNPFNPTTKIKFDVMRLGDVKIVVYDITGRVIQTLVNERLQPGTYETSFNGSQLTSGVYFYRLITDGYNETKKMLLIK